MNRADFDRQLALAHARTRTLPDWAKREAGLNMDKGELQKRMEQRQSQDEADLMLGRLVRQMPCQTTLERGEMVWIYHTSSGEDYGRTPEEALRAAGVKEEKGG